MLQTGRTMHFITRDNTYAYVRYNDECAVLVYINAAENTRFMPVDHYDEILSKYQSTGTDIVSGQPYNLKQRMPIEVPPLTALVIKLNKK